MKQPAARSNVEVATWVPADGEFVVDGHTITGGLVYIGSEALSLNGYRVEPGLIDPDLRVRWNSTRLDQQQEAPVAYDTLTASSRGAYLSWLGEGRRDPDAAVLHLFTYFFGLERRVLGDIVDDHSHPDLPVIHAELERLLDVYGRHRRFGHDVAALLEHVAALGSVHDDVVPPRWQPGQRRREVPAVLRVGVARYVANHVPLPAEWALSLVRHHPATRLRPPATYCREEFDDLFVDRYSRHFGDGITMYPASRRVSLKYRPASPGMSAVLRVTIDSLSDVTSSHRLIDPLMDLATQCCADLDASFRSRPADTECGDHHASTAADVLGRSTTSMGDDLRGRAARKLGARTSVTVPFESILGRHAPDWSGRHSWSDTLELASSLATIGIGMEPDVRFGGRPPERDTNVVLFPLPDDASCAPSWQYTVVMRLADLVTVADARHHEISPDGRRHLVARAAEALGLDDAERSRITARAEQSMTEFLMDEQAERLDSLPTSRRKDIGRFAADVVAPEGLAGSDAESALRTLFSQLGLEEPSTFVADHADRTSLTRTAALLGDLFDHIGETPRPHRSPSAGAAELDERAHIIESLSRGITPRHGTQHLQVGLTREIRALRTDLALVAGGDSVVRFIVGEYGSGTSFALNRVMSMAHEHNSVTVRVDLTGGRLLHGSNGQAQRLYTELMANLATPDQPTGDAMEVVLDRFFEDFVAHGHAPAGRVTELALRERLAVLSSRPGGADFADVIVAHRRARFSHDVRLEADALRWLRAEFLTPADARRSLGVGTIIDDTNWYEHLQVLSVFVRLAGYDGLVVAIDDVVNLARLSDPHIRTANQEAVLQIVDDCLTGAVHGLGFFFGSSPEALLDHTRGLYACADLARRIDEHTFSRADVDDDSGPVLHLTALGPDDLFELLVKLREVVTSGDASRQLLPDEAVTAFMNHCALRIGGESVRTPRGTIEEFVNLLVLLDDHPTTEWSTLIDRVEIQAADDADLSPIEVELAAPMARPGAPLPSPRPLAPPSL